MIAARKGCFGNNLGPADRGQILFFGPVVDPPEGVGPLPIPGFPAGHFPEKIRDMDWTNPSSPPVFHLPEGIRYTCQMDGACCCDWWEIRVEAMAAERILEVDWRSCSSLGGKAKSPFLRARPNARFLFLRCLGDACSFLGEDSLCRLHARFGPETKPHGCRRFPFHFIQAPDGIYVGLSFACTSVLHDMGRPALEMREEAERLYSLEPEHARIEAPIRLDASTAITWEDYLQVEKALDAILSREDQPFSTCLVAGHVWLGILRQMLKAGAPELKDKEAAFLRGPNPALGQILDFYVRQTSSENFKRAFAIASRSAAHPTLKRMVLGTLLSFRNSGRPNQWRITAVMRVIVEHLRHWMRLGSLRLEPLDKRVPYRMFQPSPAYLDPPKVQALLRRYYRHALFRKDLVANTDLFWGYCYFLLIHGLVEYYAVGLAALGEPDPELALCLVEKYFVHHSNFGRTFLYHPALADIFQYLFKRPNFAHTMVMG